MLSNNRRGDAGRGGRDRVGSLPVETGIAALPADPPTQSAALHRNPPIGRSTVQPRGPRTSIPQPAAAAETAAGHNDSAPVWHRRHPLSPRCWAYIESAPFDV